MRRLPRGLSKTAGFSLVEMMISVVVGLVVVGGVISVFTSAIKSHTDNLRMTRLNQELRVAMNMMTRDLRRAGFGGGGDDGILNTLGSGLPGTPNPFANITISTTGSAVGDCITFSYDADNRGGAPAANENLGFRLNGGAARYRITGPCNGGTWRSITDPNAIVITDLTFTLAPIPPVDVDGADSRPCQPGECVGSTIRTVDTTNTVTVREINIALTGQLAGDATVTRTLQETVRVYQ